MFSATHINFLQFMITFVFASTIVVADHLTHEQRHSLMSSIHSKNTKPEIKVRHELFGRGFRYRVNVKSLPGSPDIVLAKYRTAIFVNGCFWHGHQGCKYYTAPSTNADFWIDKIEKNRDRDNLNTQRLESLSWNVITIWECEIASKVFQKTMDRIEAELKSNKVKWESYVSRRRADNEFARDEAKRKRQIREEVEKELQSQYKLPLRILKMASEENE